MSTPWSRAHERLLKQLPTRRVERKQPEAWTPSRPARLQRAVQIGRRKFESVIAASHAFKVHRRKIYQWIESGRARYV